MDKFDREALDYHSGGRKGKLEVVPSKPTATQRDLSLAYSPGVAVPCLEIEKDPLLAYEYTARGNLVAVISNGTAVLGLGNIGPLEADTAILGRILEQTYPWSRLRQPANVLSFPELQSANIAYKLLWRLADAEAIGPILLGLEKPVHVLQRGVEVIDIVNLAAISVVDALERESAGTS